MPLMPTVTRIVRGRHAGRTGRSARPLATDGTCPLVGRAGTLAPSLVSGAWRAQRTGHRVELGLDPTAPWRPGPLPWLMRIVTRVVPTFRRWPTTYRWRATVTLGDAPTMTSRWERTGSDRGEAYGRVMRASSSR